MPNYLCKVITEEPITSSILLVRSEEGQVQGLSVKPGKT